MCKGHKFFVRALPVSDPGFGKAVPCPRCTDFFAHSGLERHEHGLGWDQLVLSMPTDPKGYLSALEYAGRRMVAERFGWACIYGNNGTGKSRWAKILAAEFCRAGVAVRYIHGKTLEAELFRDRDDQNRDTGFDYNQPNPLLAKHLSPTVLIIEEAQTINWKNQWIAGNVGDLLNKRYDLVDAHVSKRKITVLVGQYHPRLWGPMENISFLLSRCADGSFAIPWHTETQGDPPPCLQKRTCTCGGDMVYSQKQNALICMAKKQNSKELCGNSRPVEVWWPFDIPLPDARPILPALIDEINQPDAVFA